MQREKRYSLKGEDIPRLRAICKECEECIICNYCKKYCTDSLIFLINRCDKLKEI